MNEDQVSGQSSANMAYSGVWDASGGRLSNKLGDPDLDADLLEILRLMNDLAARNFKTFDELLICNQSADEFLMDESSDETFGIENLTIDQQVSMLYIVVSTTIQRLAFESEDRRLKSFAGVMTTLCLWMMRGPGAALERELAQAELRKEIHKPQQKGGKVAGEKKREKSQPLKDWALENSKHLKGSAAEKARRLMLKLPADLTNRFNDPERLMREAIRASEKAQSTQS